MSSALYLLTIDVVAAVLYPDYHDHTAQMVSELMARGAPTQALMMWEGAVYNVLVLLFAAGVLLSSGGRRAIRATGAFLLGYGLVSTVGAFLSPMDMRTEGLTTQTWLHIATTVLQGVFMLGVLVSGAFVHGRRFRWYTFTTLAVTLAFGAWAGVQSAQESTPWLGLTERVNIYLWMIWVAVLALSLWRSAPAQGRGVAVRRVAHGSLR